MKKPVGESMVVRPTERELEVLEVLWRLGPSTVREVVDALDGRHGVGYTSWQKIMTIMLEKGLVSRTVEGRGHRYAARVAQDQVRRRLAGELLERVFGGSVAALVQSALGGRPASAVELQEVEELLERAAAGEAGPDEEEET